VSPGAAGLGSGKARRAGALNPADTSRAGAIKQPAGRPEPIRPHAADWHKIDTPEAHTRTPQPGSVPAEGGGTTTPTQGGGFWFSRDTSPVDAFRVGVPRSRGGSPLEVHRAEGAR
jgi:hypothetical protein